MKKNSIINSSWMFSHFNKAPGVVICEIKVSGYDEKYLSGIEQELTKRQFRVFIERTNNGYYVDKKKKTRIEVYKKFKDGSFKDNVDTIIREFEVLGINNLK